LPGSGSQHTSSDPIPIFPLLRLEMYRKVHNLRILACGGDGTVGSPGTCLCLPRGSTAGPDCPLLPCPPPGWLDSLHSGPAALKATAPCCHPASGYWQRPGPHPQLGWSKCLLGGDCEVRGTLTTGRAQSLLSPTRVTQMSPCQRSSPMWRRGMWCSWIAGTSVLSPTLRQGLRSEMRVPLIG
jgi:hypothetical protein